MGLDWGLGQRASWDVHRSVHGMVHGLVHGVGAWGGDVVGGLINDVWGGELVILDLIIGGVLVWCW